jgi:hypothetical protein
MALGDEAAKQAANDANHLLVANLGEGGATLVWGLMIIAGFILLLIFWRYVGVLSEGGAEDDSIERQTYCDLRSSLKEGGRPTQIYCYLLTKFLDRVDRFLGDHGQHEAGIFRNAFGIRGPYPLWTAIAFERCLLLAMVYPVVTVLLAWTISGQVGPVERSLGLTASLPSWWRVMLVGFPLLSVPSPIALVTNYRKGLVAGGLIGAIALFVVSAGTGWAGAEIGKGTGIGASAFAVATTAGIAIAAVIGGMTEGSVAVIGVIALCAVSIGASTAASAMYAALEPDSLKNTAAEFFLTAANVIVASICGMALVWRLVIGFGRLRQRAARKGWLGRLIALTCAAMILSVVSSAFWLAGLAPWQTFGPAALFVVLLTVLNAPFDWFSIGLTRALLRRGVELGGWWPFGLALLDVALALVILLLLTPVLVIGVQAFNFAGMLGGGSPVFPLSPLFQDIAVHPSDPANWWVYILLLATMVPSFANLVIGSVSLTRGAPRVSNWLLRSMPPARAVPKYDRYWIASVLTVQWLVGFTLTVLALIGLVWALIGIFPGVGIRFLDYARWVASLRLPDVVARFFGP